MSIFILRNSTWSDSLILIGPIVRQYFGRRDLPRIIRWNFHQFVRSEFKLNHLKRIFISWSRLFKITKRLSPQEYIVLSSAKLQLSDFPINKKMLLIIIYYQNLHWDIFQFPWRSCTCMRHELSPNENIFDINTSGISLTD